MTLPAAPLFVLGVGGTAVGLFLLLRSFMAYERELFVHRMTQIRSELETALANGEITDSPRAKYLLNVAQVSIESVDLLTPARLGMLVKEAPTHAVPADSRTSPKADRPRLDDFNKRMSSWWVRLLLAGSPSGWALAAVAAPAAFARAIVRHQRTRRVLRARVYERLIEPTDVGLLKPLASLHRDTAIPA